MNTMTRANSMTTPKGMELRSKSQKKKKKEEVSRFGNTIVTECCKVKTKQNCQQITAL